MAASTAEAGSQRGESIFKNIVRITALSMIVLLGGVIVLLFLDSREAIARFGFSFLVTSNWDPVFEEFGAAPYIFGTIVTSVLALILAVPFAVGGALFISEYAPKTIGSILSFIIELLVAIPSIGFGLWGLFVLAPFMRSTVDPFLRNTIGPIPVIGELFKGPTIGQDLLTASVILAIMILPTILAISREVISQVPRLQKEGMLALGATDWEMLRKAVLPYAVGGIVGASMLGLARAIGETMAVTMVIGNSSQEISASLFTPGYTIASAIANQFTEADTTLYFSSIVELGLVLLLVSGAFNILARVFVRRMKSHTRRRAGAVTDRKGRNLVEQPIEIGSAISGVDERRRSFYSMEEARYVRRKAVKAFMAGLLGSLTLISVAILFLIVGYITLQGIGGLDLAFFTDIPKPLGQEGGGIAQAILGTLEMLGVGALLAVPIGVGTGIYMAEYGGGWLNSAIRFALEVLASLPSIVIGVFVWALVVRSLGSFSGLAGAIALAFVMVPIIGRSVEEILRLVPNSLREAGLALGVPRWRVVVQVVIPTVLPGIFTGVVLGVARAAGETAPLLLTALGNQFFNFDLMRPMAAMPLQIYNYAVSPYPDWHQKAWAATLVLVLVVALFSAAVRFTTRKFRYVR